MIYVMEAVAKLERFQWKIWAVEWDRLCQAKMYYVKIHSLVIGCCLCVCHRPTFIVSQLINVARHARCFKLGCCPVGWGCRIHRLFWGMRNTPSLSSLPGSLWPRVVPADKGPIYGLNRTVVWVYCFWHINCVFMLNWIVENRTVEI